MKPSRSFFQSCGAIGFSRRSCPRALRPSRKMPWMGHDDPARQTTLSDEEVLRGFEDLSLSADRFHHREHVLVGFTYLRAGGLLDTLARFPAALRRFAEAHGVGRIYHETVTWASSPSSTSGSRGWVGTPIRTTAR